MTEQRKAVIKNADMSEDMQQDAVDCASQALSKYNIEKVSQKADKEESFPLKDNCRCLSHTKIRYFRFFRFHRYF